MIVAIPSTASSSSWGATVTVRAVFHVVGVNVSVSCSPVAASVSTVATFALVLVTLTVTVPVGWPPSDTV